MFIDNYYTVNRACIGVEVDFFYKNPCLQYTVAFALFNYTSFSYGSSCCYSFLTNTEVRSITCQCQMDNCNGDLPHGMPNAGDLPSTIANRISTQSTMAQRKSSDGFS